MTNQNFQYTAEQQVALSFSYLAYSGEEIKQKSNDGKSVTQQILDIINNTFPKIHTLLDTNKQVDWVVVWGPSIYTFKEAEYQDNMMFVGKRISKPDEYILAIRGTNSDATLDWLKEDFEVWKKVDWVLPKGHQTSGHPKISKATNTGIDALLNKMVPEQELPGGGLTITEFLTQLARQGKATVTFTGHSLAGALAPTLALWFKQFQGINGEWDPANNIKVKSIPFAGATAGNRDFANYSNSQLGDECQRIHNTLDFVPHAWEEDTLKTLPDLYASAGIKMQESEKLVIDIVERTVKDYQQIKTDFPFTWTINPEHNSYSSQASYQHTHSYPIVLCVPELNDVIQK